MATLYQKRLAQRRSTADITRLADQYKRNVESLTGEQEKAFGQYQANVKQKMDPYEAAVGQYNEAFKTYESQAAAYRQRLDQHQALLADIAQNPTEFVAATASRYGKVARGVQGSFATIDGKEYSEIDLRNMGWDPVYSSRTTGRLSVITGISGVNRERAVPTFTEKAPEAPVAPTAPQIEEFDTQPFEAKRGQLESDLKRELGERRGARLSAVSRKTTRPLMQGQS